MFFDGLSISDLRQLRKSLSTECEILNLFIERPSTIEMVSSVSALAAYSMSPQNHRDAIKAEIAHCEKLIQIIDINIKDLSKNSM